MLDREAARISPVIKNLASEDMSSNPPDQLVVLFQQPVMTHELCVEVINLITSVVHPSFWKDGGSSDEKEAVMVDVLLAKVEMEETVYILVSHGIRQDIRWHKIEVRSIKFDILVKLFSDVAKVTQLMY